MVKKVNKVRFCIECGNQLPIGYKGLFCDTCLRSVYENYFGSSFKEGL